MLLTSLLTAVDAAPDDVPLRLHVATLLAERGRPAEALQHCSQALARDPGCKRAKRTRRPHYFANASFMRRAAMPKELCGP